MKKLLSLLIIACLIGCLTACNKTESQNASTTDGQSTTTENLTFSTTEDAETTISATKDDTTVTPFKPNSPVEYDPSTKASTTTAKTPPKKTTATTKTIAKTTTKKTPTVTATAILTPEHTSATTTTQKATTTAKTTAPVVTENLKAQYNADKSGHYLSYVYNNTDKEFYDAILDRTGKATYTCAKDETIDVYANGFFISHIYDADAGKQRYYLKNHTGKLIASTETLNVTGFGLVENYESHKNFLADGYVLVFNAKESYNGTTYEVGILGTNGKWLVPLSSDNPLLSGGMTPSTTAFREKIQYVGDGCLCVEVKKDDYYPRHAVYNLKTNKMLYYTMPNDGWPGNLDYMITEIEFKNGISYDTYGTSMYEFHADGTLNVYPYSADDISAAYGFYVDEKGVIYSMGSDGWGTVLSSSATGKIRDFKDDDNINISEINYIGNGKWLIMITNNEKTNYYTIVDHTGNFLFEPIKTTESYVVTTSNIGIGENSVGHGIVIDSSGKVLYRSKHDGYATSLFVKNGIVRETTMDRNYDTLKYDDYTRL